MLFLQNLDDFGSRFWVVVAGVLLAFVGLLDAMAGYTLEFSVFYLVPIALLTWFAGRKAGLWMCFCAAAVWLLVDMAGDAGPATLTGVHIWNTGVRLGGFVVVSMLLPAVQALQHEQRLARIDPLTGSANRRSLCEAVHLELLRSRRYARPMTIAFIDLDGFKVVNDGFGHAHGDKVLCTVVSMINSRVRQTDLLARIGGDEFVLLLPEIDQDAARVIMPKLREALGLEMGRHGWPVTFSIGVLTWRGGMLDAEQMITMADKLMYDIKSNGKDAIAYAVHNPEVRVAAATATATATATASAPVSAPTAVAGL